MDITTYLRGSVNYVYYFSAGFSIIFNVLLIYLVTSEPRIQVGVYKRLMVIMSLFEIFYSILDAFLIPVSKVNAKVIVILRIFPEPQTFILQNRDFRIARHTHLINRYRVCLLSH